MGRQIMTTRLRKRPMNENVQKQQISRNDIKKVVNECLWSFHCTVLIDYSLADEVKPMTSVSKNGRRMRYSMAAQHYLTCLIFWSVPPMIQKNKSVQYAGRLIYFSSFSGIGPLVIL